jgi:hypothetical protein
MSIGYVKAFASLGATLRNVQWSFSARGRDGSIVLSCWQPFFEPKSAHGIEGVLRYRDTLNRVGHNPLGASELEQFLREGATNHTSFRLVVATPGDESSLASGRSASSSKNRFHAKPDLLGELVSFDGNEYVIDFKRVV